MKSSTENEKLVSLFILFIAMNVGIIFNSTNKVDKVIDKCDKGKE